MKRALSPERKRVHAAALRLHALKRRERELRTARHGIDTPYHFAESVLRILRQVQRDLPKGVRRYRAYKKRTLTPSEVGVSSALPPGVPGALP